MPSCLLSGVGFGGDVSGLLSSDDRRRTTESIRTSCSTSMDVARNTRSWATHGSAHRASRERITNHMLNLWLRDKDKFAQSCLVAHQGKSAFEPQLAAGW